MLMLRCVLTFDNLRFYHKRCMSYVVVKNRTNDEQQLPFLQYHIVLIEATSISLGSTNIFHLYYGYGNFAHIINTEVYHNVYCHLRHSNPS